VPDYYREDKSSLVALLNVFASYYLRQGRLANDKVQKHKLFNQAAQLFGRANGIDSKEEITWAGRAFCFLFRNEPGRAGDQFQALLDQNPNNIPALLGQATILFQNQKYNEACTLYKKVIKLNPDCPPSVRIGLANCYFKLNQMELCKLAFERVLELETDDDIRVEALVGLAVLAKNERRYDVLSKHVNEAIRLNSQHSKGTLLYFFVF
jgi:RNA polymerase-associated protein CTR9